MKFYFKYKRRLVTFLIYLVVALLIVIVGHSIVYPPENIHCYRIDSDRTLPNVQNQNPKRGKSIFFHETSCKSFSKGKIWITARQACAVESAALLNPNSDVYLLYTSPMAFNFAGDESDKFLKVLLSYPNVRIMYLNYDNYTKGSPVEELYGSGKIEESLHVVAHSSDVLRYLTLWKYGGVYMDLDVVVLRTLDDLKVNYAGIESSDVVASGVLNFEATGFGHELVEKCLTELRDTFDGKEWSKNGPGVITRLLKSLCGTNETEKMTYDNCRGFTVYSQQVFYPVPWEKWKMYFEEKYLETVINMTQNSYAIHSWNKLSENAKIPLTTNAPYLYFARKFCPQTVNACDNFF